MTRQCALLAESQEEEEQDIQRTTRKDSKSKNERRE